MTSRRGDGRHRRRPPERSAVGPNPAGPPWGDRFLLPGNRTRLGGPMYLGIVMCGLGLAAAQILILPRLLGSAEFGVAIIGFSLTQAGLSVGDLALSFTSQSTTLLGARRAEYREAALLVATILVGGAALVTILVGQFNDQSSMLMAAALGLLSALVLEGSLLRARSYEQAGDEKRAAAENLCWQNAPKFGLLVGAAIGRSPVACLAGGLVCSLAVGRPLFPRFSVRVLSVLGDWRRWGPALASVVAVFVVTWSDTYVIAAHLGLAAAAGYETTYRAMSSVTYLFQPWSSVMLSRLNAGVANSVGPILALSLALTAAGLAVLTVLIRVEARRLFPGLPVAYGALGPLALLFLFANISYLLGNVLVSRGKFGVTVLANCIALVVAVVGHTLFTSKGGSTTAAVVSACSGGAAALVCCVAVALGRRSPAPSPSER